MAGVLSCILFLQGEFGVETGVESPGENNPVGANQKTSDKPIKTLWGRLRQHLGQVLDLDLVICGSSDAVLGSWFFL